MKFLCETYSSIDKLLTTLNSRQPNIAFKGRTQDSCKQDYDYAEFSGTKSYEEAVELIRNGWDEPVKKLDAEIKTLNAKSNVSTHTARPRNAVVGYAPCVPAAIMGLPESMISSERVPKKVKAVSIIYANSNLGDTSAEQYIKAGAVILKMVNDLELKGYRVNLICEFRSSIKNNEVCIGRVTIKDWRQPLDLKKITFPMAHASMQRRFGFRYQETLPTVQDRDWYYGYGRTCAREWSYERQVREYKDHGLLKDNDYFISMPQIQKCRFDTEAVMKQAGMKLR